MLKNYIKLAWFCKTPFVFLQDRKYTPLTDKQIATLFEAHEKILTDLGYRWTGEIWDCDDAQSIFKGIASELKMNAVWSVSGFLGRFPWQRRHAFGLIWADNGLRFVEPQNINKKDMRGYKALRIMWG